MNPAAVISTLIQIEGMESATARLKEYDTLSQKASVSVDKATASTTAHGKAAEESSKHVGSAAKAMGGYLAAFGGYEVIKSATDATSEFYHSTQQLTQNFGLSSKAASEWGAVMQSRGVDATKLTLTFKTLSAQVHSASEGSKSSTATFKELGISQQELKKHGDDLNWVLGQVSDGLAKMPPGTDRASLSSKLFGRTWQTIAPIVRDGKKSMDEQLSTADKYGATIGGSQKAIEGMIEKQRDFKLATLGLQITLGNVLMPILLTVANVILKVDTAFRSAPPGIKAVALGVIGLSAAFAAMNIVMEMNPLARIATLLVVLGTALVVAYQKSATFRDTIQSAWTSIKPVVEPVITWLQNAVKFMGQVIDDLFNGGNGGNATAMAWAQGIVAVFMFLKNTAASIFDFIKANWQTIVTVLAVSAAPITATIGAIILVITHFGAIVAWIKNAWSDMTQWLVTAWKNASAYLSPTIQDLATIFRRVFEIIVTVVTPFGQFITGVFQIVKTAFDLIIGVAEILFVNAFKTAFAVVKTVINGLAPVVAAMASVIKGIIEVFAGALTLNFTKMWNGVKTIVSGAWDAIKGIIKTEIGLAIDIVTGAFNLFYNAGKFIINAIGSGIKAAWNGVLDIVSSFINHLLIPINLVLGAIGVKQIHVNLGGSGGGGNSNSAAQNLQKAGFAQGGMVNAPGYFAGEEAPRHPEFILATNPAYRQRNVGLWTQAGSALGIPGFAAGGVAGGVGGVPTTGTPNLSKSQLAQLWIMAGGPSSLANVAAAIALAESGGADVVNSIGATGYWQIHPGGPQYLPPLANAQAAVAKWRGAPGGGDNFSPWVTYVQGTYKKYLGSGGIGSLISGAAGAIGSGVSSLLDLIPSLPSAPKLPKPWSDIPGAILDKVTSWIKKEVGNILPSGPKGTGGGGEGMFDGHPTASWIIPILTWARQHGWAGTETSGYRNPAQQLSAAEGYGLSKYGAGGPLASNHTKLAYPGGAVDVTDASQLNAVLQGYTGIPNLVWGGPVIGDQVHFSATGHRKGGIHYAGAFAKGGILNANGPTMAIFGENGPETAMFIPRFAQGGAFSGLASAGTPPTGAAFTTVVAPSRPSFTTVPGYGSWRGALGIPALPNIAGSAGTTISAANSIQGTINGINGTISGLDHQLSVLDTVSGWSQEVYLDPTTGLRDEVAINKRLGELTKLSAMAKQIFDDHGRLVVWLQRLVVTYRNIVNKLKVKKATALSLVQMFESNLRGISLKGLKGSHLTAAKKEQTDLQNQITKYKGIATQTGTDIGTYSQKVSDTAGLVTSGLSDRDSSWQNWMNYMNEATSVSGTVDQPVTSTAATTATSATTADLSALLASTQAVALQAQQSYNVSQAQYKALSTIPPYGGSFADGGVVPGPKGAPRTIIAHGGETVGAPIVVHVHVHDGAVDPNKIEVIAQNAAMKVTRRQSRSGSNASMLPGSRGGV